MTVSVASRIVAGRLVRGLTQRELALSLGVTRRTVSRWETGRGTVPEWRREQIFWVFAEMGGVD